jgi:hypothetical protein
MINRTLIAAAVGVASLFTAVSSHAADPAYFAKYDSCA